MRSVKSLLNWKARLKAHYLTWFDRSSASHLDVGYDSSDPAVIDRHLNDMQSAGVDVVTPDYYGSGNLFGVKVLSLLVMGCVKRGMTIAPCFDGGMVKHRPDMSISATAYMVGQMRAFKDKYSAVMEKLPDGRYLCDSFSWNSSDPRFDIDESKVCASLPEYAILFREKGGFSKTGSSGSFAWAFTDHAAWLLAAAKAGKIGCGALCKGFDDHNRRPGADPTKSVWDSSQPARILAERDGQQWLDTIKIYNDSAYKPPYMQLVTWNDQEEGTELEYGIDSHVTCAADYYPLGLVIPTIKGNLATIQSTSLMIDGKPIAIGDSLDLKSISVPDGPHQMYVIAEGKPLFIDKTSPVLTATSKTVPRVIWS
jgi:hypothetical protein